MFSDSIHVKLLVTDTEAFNKLKIIIIIEYKAEIVKHSLTSNTDDAPWHVIPWHSINLIFLVTNRCWTPWLPRKAVALDIITPRASSGESASVSCQGPAPFSNKSFSADSTPHHFLFKPLRKAMTRSPSLMAVPKEGLWLRTPSVCFAEQKQPSTERDSAARLSPDFCCWSLSMLLPLPGCTDISSKVETWQICPAQSPV